MIDVEKHAAYWREGAQEDWAVAQSLVKGGHARHGLFFAHLTLEKALKALVVTATRDLPPRIHNLLRLAEIAGLSISTEQRSLLAELNSHHIEGRYPDLMTPEPTAEEIASAMNGTQVMVLWLTSL
jgi:HEPN domain-containing protein